MSIASLKVVPEEIRTSIIRVYNYQDKNLQGTFFNAFYGEEIVFGNFIQLILTMEELMDKMDYPQASARSRAFKTPPYHADRARIAEQLLLSPDQEIIATFKVKVLFRQGASWQGELAWMESGETASFRSTLELIKLIDSVLPQSTATLQDSLISAAVDAG
ncbi:MAG: hypothetical protein II239_01320 [Peptococcaceae bacterium]|nr:hypothetical protein [Peptococcaceae bacterium]